MALCRHCNKNSEDLDIVRIQNKNNFYWSPCNSANKAMNCSYNVNKTVNGCHAVVIESKATNPNPVWQAVKDNGSHKKEFYI